MDHTPHPTGQPDPEPQPSRALTAEVDAIFHPAGEPPIGHWPDDLKDIFAHLYTPGALKTYAHATGLVAGLDPHGDDL